ncbi:MAG: hypothetical protein ACYDBB_22540 [Armatimonadota bacterium]
MTEPTGAPADETSDRHSSLPPPLMVAPPQMAPPDPALRLCANLILSGAVMSSVLAITYLAFLVLLLVSVKSIGSAFDQEPGVFTFPVLFLSTCITFWVMGLGLLRNAPWAYQRLDNTALLITILVPSVIPYSMGFEFSHGLSLISMLFPHLELVLAVIVILAGLERVVVLTLYLWNRRRIKEVIAMLGTNHPVGTG